MAKLRQEDDEPEIIDDELLETLEEEALSEFDATDDGSEGMGRIMAIPSLSVLCNCILDR